MKKKLIPVYFVPGLAADVSIFEHIILPTDQFIIHTIPWKIPKKNEAISAYAKRMCDAVKDEDSVLIGVSFGGVVAQEMSAFLNLKRLIIISSVKSNSELPGRMKFTKITKAYKIMPTALVSRVDDWEKLAFGDFAKKRAAMYQKYMAINDKGYLDWAIENMVCWDREEALPEVIHIHGDKDVIFPIGNIKNCIRVPGGTHVMIVNRAKWFNERLPAIILGENSFG